MDHDDPSGLEEEEDRAATRGQLMRWINGIETNVVNNRDHRGEEKESWLSDL